MEKFILSAIFLILTVKVLDGTARKVSRNNLFSFSPLNARPLKKSLGFDEDIYLNFTELSTKYNYPTEEHQVLTDDGYFLTLFRVLPKCQHAIGYPIILLHGIYDSSDAWIVAGPQNGLAYILANNCYDVWAANHRGNVYSRKHIKYDPDIDPEYWNYSFDEHGFYDVPAMVDYVIERTGLPKVIYFGHSQGTTDFFVMTSLKPEYNTKIQLSVHLAPVVFLSNVGMPILKLLAPAARDLKQVFDWAGFNEVLAKHQLVHAFVEYSCHYAPDAVCGTGLYATTGYKSGSISSKTLSIVGGHFFAGISTKSLVHLGQLISSRKFQRYDEGIQGNIQRYGVTNPPEYDLSKVTSSVLLMTGQNDFLSPLEDVNNLASKLPNLVQNCVIPDPTWSHNNHLWGKYVWEFEFPKILEYLKRFNS